MERKKLPEREGVHETQSKKSSFSKSLSPGQNWKSKSMRIIPEEILRSTPEAFEHRVVFTVPWNNSWQLWLQGDKNCLFMIKEDWDEFVDDNLLASDDTLHFTHQGTMYFQVRIFKKDGKEIISAPLEVEPPHNSHQETTPASASGGGRKSFAHVENPERYLFNPSNPYFEKTLTKTNTALYVSTPVVKKYELEFGPRNSSMHFLLPDGNKMEGFNKIYSGLHAFLGWADVCQKYNLKQGDTVVCEFELSRRVVTAVRVHFVTASNSASVRQTSRGRQSFGHVENPERYLLNPNNPYFEKTLTKTNSVLYVSPPVIKKYGLEFGPHSSSIDFLLPDGSKMEGFTKSYGGLYGFLGWAAVCQKYNLKPGDTVVCEFELSRGVVSAVRVHFVNE
ncbi:hypothetical protein HID58_067904 [Brassica napus]|uniref:(rape) hypothetical protein n=1 Tax=Brassica napus TaxID=3708 RepID=A0A816L8Z3_BRANA|nr:B3 domain-containing protein At5g25470 [Brassica napus]KAH0880510.1 hypothetical protein HID58_067904 [Brassica napus]CAF1933448.1 unnamed protein product [Brassica napus]